MQAIIIARLYAMYQKSRRILIFLVIVFVITTVVRGINTGRATSNISTGEHQSDSIMDEDIRIQCSHYM